MGATITPGRVARKLYRTSPDQLVRAAERRLSRARAGRRAAEPITAAFLRSAEYQELMNKHVPYHGQYGLHEAQTATKSFMFRSFEVNGRLRAYRWRGIQEHLDLILDLIDDPSKVVIDLGGAGSSFGLGSIIVDQLPFDEDGNPVRYKTLDELPGKADVILSSHTLEHIPELERELQRIRDTLQPGGTFIALLPAFSCERWRVGTHSHADFGDHVWTFGLSGTEEVPEGLIGYVDADVLFARFFRVESAAYCGDDSIFIVAKAE